VAEGLQAAVAGDQRVARVGGEQLDGLAQAVAGDRGDMVESW